MNPDVFPGGASLHETGVGSGDFKFDLQGSGGLGNPPIDQVAEEGENLGTADAAPLLGSGYVPALRSDEKGRQVVVRGFSVVVVDVVVQFLGFASGHRV